MIKGEKNYPVGLGGLRQETAEYLPVVEVKNRLIRFNQDFEGLVPLEFKTENIGKPSKLGRMFSHDPSNSRIEVIKFSLARISRAGVMSRALFKDKSGKVYRDLSVKGIGVCIRIRDKGDQIWGVGPINSLRERTTDSEGICDISDLEKDWDLSEKFYSSGLRVPRPVAIIELEEIVSPKGGKISVQEARCQSIILSTERPGLYFRAWGIETRMDNLKDAPEGSALELLNDARIFVAQELEKIQDNFSFEDYLEELAKRIGQAVKYLASANYSHGNLSSGQNFTLDGTIADFDTAMVTKGHRFVNFEAVHTVEVFGRFLNRLPVAVKNQIDVHRIQQILHSYLKLPYL